MAAQSTSSEIMALSYNVQAFVPEAEARRSSTFLSLAPTTSASYPTNPRATAVTQSQAAAPGSSETTPVVEVEVKTRRSSSLSSEGSNGSAQKMRFLRLGPVHFGEGQGDWSEEVVTE